MRNFEYEKEKERQKTRNLKNEEKKVKKKIVTRVFYILNKNLSTLSAQY